MKIKINGKTYNGGLSNWTISEKIGNPTASSIQIEVQAGDIVPQAGDVIQILEDDDTPVFFGLIGIPKSPQYRSFFQPKIYTMNCTNGNSVLSRRIVNYSFVNKTITEIVNILYSDYISSEGITLGVVSDIPSPVFEVYNCKNMNLLAVLNELAGYINGAWQVTDDKVFNFVALEDFPLCSQDIDKDTACITNLQVSDSDRDLRTNQVIDGAYLTTDPQDESVTVTAQWQGFLTAFAVIEKPRIWVNGVEVPPEEIGTKGINEEDTTRLFYWSYNSRQISLNSQYTGTITVQEGDTVRILYIGLAPIRYEIRNASKIDEIAQRTGLSGIIDNVYNDPTIVTREDAKAKAEGLLAQYGEQQHTVVCEVDRDFALANGFLTRDFELYTQWHFNLPEVNLVGDYVLTEKNVQPLVLNDDESLYMKLTFTDRNFIQSYGEIISNLYHDIVKLTVRAEETVIVSYEIKETTALSERVEGGGVMALYVADSMENGQIAQPLGTIMPNLVHGGGSAWRMPFTLWCGDDCMEPLAGSITGIEVACS